MTAAEPPEILRARLLLLLEKHSKSGSPNYVKDDELAAATTQPVEEIRRQLDILEELGLTTTANSRDGRRARISARGILKAEELLAIPPSEPTKRRIGFDTDR
jgi:DNA-binding transcriptional ArsR family regulator